MAFDDAALEKWRHLEVMNWCDWDAPEVGG